MTSRQVLYFSVGGALIVLLIIAFGVFSARNKTCRDFNQAMVMVDDQLYGVALSQSDTAKEQGLIGCQSVPNKSGMYFVYQKPTDAIFWMKGMSFPIDIVWVSHNRVIGIERNVPVASATAVSPPLYKPNEQVDGVFEVGAGKASEYGIKEGSLVTLISK